MLIYDTQFINNYYKTLEHEKLELSVQSLLNTILIVHLQPCQIIILN